MNAAVDSQISGVEQTVETTSGAVDSTLKDSTLASLTPAELQALTPQLDVEEGWYWIGDKNDPQNRTFMLCITVAFAANLKHLLPPGVPIKCPSSTSDSNGGFFFFYTLFGNSVTTDPFFDVLEPNFPSERASVRVRATFDKLDSFLRLQHPGIEIHLCFGAQSLGKAALPIQNLLAGRASQIFMQPVSIEETYRLTPKSSFGSSSSSTLTDGIPQDAYPMVGVAMTIKLDESELPASGGEPSSGTAAGEERGGDGGGKSGGVPTGSKTADGEIPVITIEDSYVDGGGGGGETEGKVGPVDSKAGPVDGQGELERNAVDARSSEGRTIDVMGGGDATSSLAKQGRSRDELPSLKPTSIDAAASAVDAPTNSTYPVIASSTDGGAGRPTSNPISYDFTPLPVPSLPNVIPQPAPLISQSLSPSASIAIPPSSHHLCYTIELRSFKDLDSSLTRSKLVFLRYLYPFFGFNEPLHTFPASKVVPNAETMLPNSYCAFDFASPLPHLNQTFTNHPLMVELWGRSEARRWIPART